MFALLSLCDCHGGCRRATVNGEGGLELGRKEGAGGVQNKQESHLGCGE